jgi:CheY-like chemotaxis protein
LRRIETDFAPMAREKELRFQVMPASLRVVSDANLLRRLIQNLVSNAIKYTVEGTVLVGAKRRGNQVVIEVHDTGIGIPASKLRTVFKEFVRLDDGAKTAAGLGLGLSIVDRLSRLLDHPVRLRSKPGRGTVFSVEVPHALAVAAPAATSISPDEGHVPSALDGLRVACIDNEPQVLQGMRLLLEGWGCVVIAGGSVADMDDDVPAPGSRVPDVVVADYHLDRSNGIEAILQLRTLYGSEIPALLITADRTPEVRALAEGRGIYMHHKPVKPAALRAYLAQVARLRKVAAE